MRANLPSPAGRLVPSATGNGLLARLPPKDRERFVRACESVELVFNETIAEPGDTMHHIHFPIGGVVSLLALMPGGGPIEGALVGNEGVVGIPPALRVEETARRLLVPGDRTAFGMTPAEL